MSKMPKEPKSITKKFLLITFIIYGILVQVLQRVSTDLLMKVTGAYLIISFFGAVFLEIIYTKKMDKYINELKEYEKIEREKQLKEMEKHAAEYSKIQMQNQNLLDNARSGWKHNAIVDSLPTYYDDDEDEDIESFDDDEDDEEEYVYVPSGRGEVRYTLTEWNEELEEEERQRREEQEEAEIRAREEEERLRRAEEEELELQEEEEEYYWNYVRPALDEIEYPDA